MFGSIALRIQASLLIAILSISGQGLEAQAPSAKVDASIEGIVLRVGTNEPIPSVQVTITQSTLAQAVGSVATDQSGRFAFSSLKPGQYTVLAQREGYLAPGISPILTRASVGATLAESQHLRGLTIFMVAGVTISGRVFGAAGSPVVGMAVEAVQLNYRDGRLALNQQDPTNTASTDDRGEYRLFSVMPGEYYLRIRDRRTGPGGMWSEHQYFPGVPDILAAKTVTVRAGEEARNIDFLARAAPLSTSAISGRLSNSNPVAPRQTAIYLLPKRSVREAATITAINVGFDLTFDAATGVFFIQGVPPGVYDLFAVATFDQNRVESGRAAIQIDSRDVTDVKLEIQRGVDIEGRIRVNGGAPQGQVSNALVGLTPMDATPTGALRVGTGSGQLATVDRETGRFTMIGVPPGLYRFRYGSALPAGAWVSARLGEKDILEEDFNVGNIPPGSLEVEINLSGASIEGVVKNSKETPVGGAVVVLVPHAARRTNSRLYRTAQSDKDGRFLLTGAAPGQYTIFAWEIVSPDAWQNPNLITRYESRGVPVTVGSESISSLAVRVIPSESD